MKHLFLAIHHPKPEHAEDLLAAMTRFGATLATVPGMLGASAWAGDDRIVAMSVWESRERFLEARSAMGEAIADVPFERWEARPRELLGLDEVEQPGAL
ncbi:MAG TPA: antibiotic biosynthesis monooxygenase [Candidatus Dormibacteraeota bacterium]|nr:antibiotic biosynthesis monooxygenase [Candidatus Dormibacteraeota bacterium]